MAPGDDASAGKPTEMCSTHRSVDKRFKMALRERSARARFQVALEADGRGFVGEVKSHHDCPRPVACRVAASPAVVGVETSLEVVRDADVRETRFWQTPKNVDDVLGRHVAAGCKVTAER
jgi:hypothetical protein